VAVTPAVKAKADEVTLGLKTDDEKTRAIYSYVSTQIRYISISFGAGRYQPHAADVVLANQYGDCKDKDTLLQAMLQAEGIQASAVLIGSSLKLNPDVPTPAQFDHVITAVQLGKGRIWLDSTPEVAPYQMLLQPLRDKQALLIPGTGPATIVTTPADPPFATFFNLTATGTISSEGVVKGHMDVTTRGDSEVYFRSALHQTARAQWQELLQNVSYAQGFSGTVSNVDAMLPEKTGEPLHYSYDYERKEFGDWGNRRIPALLPPVDWTFPGDDKPDEPLELVAIGKEELSSTITLPDGYTAQTPEGLNLKSDIADYSSTYLFKDKKILVTRRLTIKVKKVPLEEWEDYKKFQKQVADDYGQMIQLYSGNDLKQEATDAGNSEAQRLVQEAFQEIRDQKLSQAAETLDNAEKANPEQWGLWAGRGYLHQQKRDVDASLKDYRMEIKLHPKNRGAYEAMIWTESHFGKQDEIVPTLEQMRAAFPDDTEVEVKLGNALVSKKEYAKAVPLFADAVKSQPDDQQYAVWLGSAQLKAGMKDEGETTLKGVLTAGNDPLILNDAAYELADAGMEFQLAEESCRRSLTIQAEKTGSIGASAVERKDFSNVDLLVSTWDTMGWILFKEGKFSEAVTYLEPSWRLSQSRLIGYHLGQVYEAMGKKTDALHTYELALSSLAPGGAESDKVAMTERAEKLAAGKALEPGSKRTEELLKMRTINLPEFEKGYKTADFNLVWSRDGLQEVVFVKGDEELRAAEVLLKKANPPQPMPPDSKAKLLRRGIMACSDITKSCQMVLMYPQDAVSQAAAPIKIEKK
jgi:tetratricopeptide (TPR) repeat protein